MVADYVIIAKVTIENLFDFLMICTNRFQQSKVKNHALKSSPPKDWV